MRLVTTESVLYGRLYDGYRAAKSPEVPVGTRPPPVLLMCTDAATHRGEGSGSVGRLVGSRLRGARLQGPHRGRPLRSASRAGPGDEPDRLPVGRLGLAFIRPGSPDGMSECRSITHAKQSYRMLHALGSVQAGHAG